MLTPIGNVHRHKLPLPGEIGRIRGLSLFNPKQRWIVVSYPLCDSADRRYSIGIHTVILAPLNRRTDSRYQVRISGHWFESEGE